MEEMRKCLRIPQSPIISATSSAPYVYIDICSKHAFEEKLLSLYKKYLLWKPNI